MRLMEKLLIFLGLAEAEEEEENQEEMVTEKGKVVSLPSGKYKKTTIIIKPQYFEDAQEIAENLKNGFLVIMNLEQTDPDTSKEIIDFVSGAIFAINGDHQKIHNDVFVFSPPSISLINKEDMEEEKKSGVRR